MPRNEQRSIPTCPPRRVRKSAARAHRARTGLAPLELVLALPILLFLMALMVNYGTVASWKVRGLAASRHALWSSRWPRTPAIHPRPRSWPTSAALGAGGSAAATSLDDPRVDLPVVRGPMPNDVLVHHDLLDPTVGMREGRAALERDFPMLARMGAYSLTSLHELLDNQWQYQRTGWPEQGEMLPRNNWRRIPVIYRLPRVPPSLVEAYVTAAYAIVNAAFRGDLCPLETWKDPEVVAYCQRFGWDVFRRDLHPVFCRRCADEPFCTRDAAAVDSTVENLIDRIQGRSVRGKPDWIPGVAWHVTETYIAFYQRVVRALEAQLDAVPPPSPADVLAIQAEIGQLEAKIEVLREFRAEVENHGG